MQTFLPYPDFKMSAQCLDRQRLGKQRVEAYQILNILHGKIGPKSGWINHPAVLMWKGYEDALSVYLSEMIGEWIDRGYKNTLPRYSCYHYDMPPWFGDNRLHHSHRSALLAKFYEHYKQFNWDLAPIINYWWPTKMKADSKENWD